MNDRGEPSSTADAEEARRIAELIEKYDWSFARAQKLVFAAHPNDGGGYIVLPREVLHELVAARDVATWGELRQRVPPERVQQVADWCGVLEEDGDFEGKTPDDIPDSEPYDGVFLHDRPEGHPGWPHVAMEEWLPQEIAEEFGGIERTMFGDSGLVVIDIEGLIAGLESGGAICEPDHDNLIRGCY